MKFILTFFAVLFLLNIPASAQQNCTYTLNPTSIYGFTDRGGNGSFTVNTQAGCAWTATTPDNWITISTASGTGTGDVTFSIPLNPLGNNRTGTIKVNNETFSIVQYFRCEIGYSGSGITVPASGGSADVVITVVNGCVPQISNLPSYITYTN